MTNEQKKFMEVSGLYLTASRSMAAKTSQDNRRLRLENYLESVMDHEVDPGIVGVLAWKQDMVGRGMQKSSIRQYLMELRAFYDWAIDHGFYNDNPVKRSDVPKSRQNPYHLMSEDQMMRLLDERKPKLLKDKFWMRNRTIVIVFITASLRNAELRALTPGDLDWVNSEIYVRSGKGDKDRFVDFPKLAQVAVREYLDSGFRPAEAGDDAPLFGYVKDGHWCGLENRVSLTQLINRHVARVVPEYDRLVGTHALRHVGASLLLTNGDSIERIQQTLGHANLETTKRYAEMLRPDKSHVESANRIWDEIAYQAGRGESALRKRQETRVQEDRQQSLF